tara:strand:- start:5691 stop:6308 length:618 start_codon:yes stop_codon:yes gene_type:complete
MAFPTTGSATELQAINQVLASIGQAPVTTLEQTNPDVAIVISTLDQTSREVQAEGWTFNQESYYPITPDSDGLIQIPHNMIRLDLSQNFENERYDAVQRNGYLYDRRAHTYTWTYSPKCDVTWELIWDDLPHPPREYIVSKAAAMTSQRLVGDPTQYQALQQQSMLCRANAMEYETEQGDYSFFGCPDGQGNYYRPYKPFHALYR